MYREVVALSIHRSRPWFEVLIAPPWTLDGRAERFLPHVLVQDYEEAGLPLGLPDGVVCRFRILAAESLSKGKVAVHGHLDWVGYLPKLVDRRDVRDAPATRFVRP